MIEGNFVLTPGVIAAVAWLVLAVRRHYGIWTTGLGLVAIAHMAGVIAVTLFPLPVQAEVIEEGRTLQLAGNNIVPLASLARAVATGSYPAVIYQSIGNLIMLAPLGFYAPLMWRRLRTWRSAAVAGLAVSIVIEGIQLAISAILGYTYKIADIDDVILNVVGVLAGYLAFRTVVHWLDEDGAFRLAESEQPPGISTPGARSE